MSMQQRDNRKVLLNLIKMAVIGRIDFDDTNIDWKWIYEVSSRHSICNIIAYAIDRLENKPSSQIIAIFDNARNMQMLQESVQQVEAEIILSRMEQTGVVNMPMKGFITKNLYPSPDMRSMCDVDILIKDECIDKAEEIMKELKYPVREGGMREIVYKRPPYLSFELHRYFVSEKYQKIVYDYYEDIWEKTKLTDGKKYTYELPNEDFYIYMIVHIAKHYLSGGIGIRAILDVFVFLEHYGESLNREYIKEELKKIELLEFCENIQKLAYVWFKGSDPDAVTLNMTDFIFSGGTYGNKRRSDAAYALQDGYSGGKLTGIKRYINAIFLPYENMCQIYPKLKKHRWMLMFYWIYRIVDRFINKRDKVKMKMMYTAEKEDVKSLKNHLKQVGLK